MKDITLLVGVPASGKSWVTHRVHDLYDVVQNDEYIGKDYIGALLKASEGDGGKPVLGECPFSISQVKDPLEAKGRRVKTVFIVEDEDVLANRYYNRSGKEIPKGHLSRQETYRQRALESGSFKGTSDEVLGYLRRGKT